MCYKQFGHSDYFRQDDVFLMIRRIIPKYIDKSGGWGYFYGASQGIPTMGGAREVIY